MSLTTVTGGGTTVEYVTSCLPQNNSCTLSKHLFGTLQGYTGSTCLVLNGVATYPAYSSAGAPHNVMCNMFFPKGTSICAAGGGLNIMGCLFD